MSLDLATTATQIDQMAVDLEGRHAERELRLQRALGHLQDFSLEVFDQKLEQAEEAVSWAVPGLPDSPDARFPTPPPPPDFCVAAVDGSHIDVDRHLPVRCFLINTGVSVLTYGSDPDAMLYSHPKLHARDQDLVVRDTGTYREQPIEGAVLGAKRTVEEIRALVEVVSGLPSAKPTLALLDGSLVMLGLVGALNQDFVLRELVEEGFGAALEELREMASGGRPLAVAAYISLPRTADVVSALRLLECPSGVSASGYRCGPPGLGRQPCEGCVGGVLDRDIFARLLKPGERSAVFTVSSPSVAQYYGGTGISFFYVNSGEEIGRVEVPSWVADDLDLLDLAHSLVVDQCQRGRGYPVALMEAHEQAVVSGADRRYFVQLVEGALYDQRLPVFSSEKARSKRLRWL